MSRLRSDKVVNKAGTGAPELTYGAVVPATGTISGAGGINVTGVVTATSFSGDGSALTGIDATALKDSGGNVKIQASATGSVLSGVSTATTFNATTLNVSGNATIDGNLTVSGTQTIIDTATLSVEDANIGIGSVSNPSNVTADGAGLTVFGGSDGDKTLKWLDSSDRWTFAGGAVEATAFHGDGSNLTGVISGVEVLQGGASSGTAITALNFSGATIESDSATGISTITIAAGIGTEATVASGAVVTLDLSTAQDHKITATGICTITCSGGTEGESHTVRITNSGTATIGFSTYFLWPSGATPSLPSASGAKSLVSFTVNSVGAGGTELLAGASVNFS